MGSMYQAETPAGLCKYKDNEKGNQAPGSLSLIPDKFFRNFMVCADNYWFLCLFRRDL